MSLYYLHAGLNILGALLLISGACVAIFRDSFENWYSTHRMIQLSGITVIICSVLLGLWLRAYQPLPNADQHWIHGTLGIILAIFLVIQAWWAIVMSKKVDSQTYLWVHRGLAVTIVIMILVQVYLGWKAITNN